MARKLILLSLILVLVGLTMTTVVLSRPTNQAMPLLPNTIAGATPAVPTSSSQRQLEQYRLAESGFLESATKSPEKVVSATVSLAAPVKLVSLQVLLEDTPVRVTAIYHIAGSFAGGYYLQPSEDLSKAAESVLEQYRKMLSTMKEGETAREQAFADPAARARFDTELIDFESAVTHGDIRYYGLVLKGSTSDIARLKASPDIALIVPTNGRGSAPVRF